MFKVIHPNRWLIWTIALIVMIFIVVWGAVERYAIEQEYSYTGEEIYYSVRLHKRASPSAVDISNWKTYRNEKYGFEFRYPSDWGEGTQDMFYISQDMFYISKENTPPDPLCGRGGDCLYPDGSSISLFIRDKEILVTLSQYVEARLKFFQDSEKKITEKIITNHKAVQVSNWGEEGGPGTSVFLEINPENVIQFTLGYTHEDEFNRERALKVKEESTATFNKILSTLTFFEPKR